MANQPPMQLNIRSQDLQQTNEDPIGAQQLKHKGVQKKINTCKVNVFVTSFLYDFLKLVFWCYNNGKIHD